MMSFIVGCLLTAGCICLTVSCAIDIYKKWNRVDSDINLLKSACILVMVVSIVNMVNDCILVFPG